MSALENQMGGNHYKIFKYQPVEFIVRTRMPFIKGCIIKYIVRYKYNGLEDLKKVMHYANLAIELHDDEYRHPEPEVLAEANRFIEVNELSEAQRHIVILTVYGAYDYITHECEKLIKAEYGEPEKAKSKKFFVKSLKKFLRIKK